MDLVYDTNKCMYVCITFRGLFGVHTTHGFAGRIKVDLSTHGVDGLME